MGFKQPRVPEYHNGDGIEKHMRMLTLFLKDFCQEVWTESRAQSQAIDALEKAAKNEEKTAQP